MTPDKIAVTFFGYFLIAFIYWFFFGKKPTVAKAGNGMLTINVEGGYKPDNIILKKNHETAITFIRNDASACLEEAVIPEFNTRVFLPLNKPVTITLNPKKKGEFSLHCGMNMYHAKISVI